MSLSLVTAPAEEPLSIDEAKAQCRVTTDDEWSLLEGLIVAAREYAEAFTHRALISQVWDLQLDAFPETIWVPRPPLQVITAVPPLVAGSPVISYLDTAGVTQTLATNLYVVDAPAGPHARPGRIVPAYQQSWPTTRDQVNAVTVRFTAGYGAAEDVPYGIKAAMKLLIAHWWINREAVTPGGQSPLPLGVDSFLWQFKAF